MSSVIKHFLVRIRVKALRQTVKSSIGSIELKYLSELLAFEDLETFRQFIQGQGIQSNADSMRPSNIYQFNQATMPLITLTLINRKDDLQYIQNRIQQFYLQINLFYKDRYQFQQFRIVMINFSFYKPYIYRVK
ncbi:hypothetical protein pb186bvf_004498 [Paramecium bursaria]